MERWQLADIVPTSKALLNALFWVSGCLIFIVRQSKNSTSGVCGFASHAVYPFPRACLWHTPYALPYLYFCHTTPRIAAYPRGEHCPQPRHARPRPKHSAPAVAHATKGSLKPFSHVSGCVWAWWKNKPPLVHRLNQRKPCHATPLRCHAFGKHCQRAHPHAVIVV